MFTSLLRFEANYQVKRKAFLGFGIVFLAFGFMLGGQGFAPANVNFNSAYQISYNMALTSLGSVFAIMFFTINGILRDKQYRTEALIYTTSIKKHHFFYSRFLGVFITSILVFSMALVGFYLGTLSPSLDQERLMSPNFTFYAWTWLIIIVPNIFICTAIIFSVSALTKNTIATYTSAIFMYAAYFMCSIFFNSPLMANTAPGTSENLIIAALADPFGLSAFFEQTQYWTPFQKNSELISFSGNFMINRILWITISLLTLATAYKLYSFKKLNLKKIKKDENLQKEVQVVKAYIKTPKISFDRTAQFAGFISLLKIELKDIFKSLPFIAIMLVWIFIVISEIYIRIYEGGAYNDSLYPTTNLLIGLIKDPFPILGLLLIIFYSGELVWRERSLNFNSIIDTTPATNFAFFLSKGFTLLMLPIILITASILIAISFQIANNYYEFEIWQYISMYYFMGTGLLFNILLALFIQTLSPNKYLGMLLTGLIIIVFQSPVAINLGIEHSLFRIGKLPLLEYTNMNGYGDFAMRFHHYTAFWLSLAVILSIITYNVWQRGIIDKFKSKLKKIRLDWTLNSRILLYLFCSIFVASGTTIFYNTNVLTKYISSKEDLEFREGYEKKYGEFENLEQLILIDSKTKMDLYPNEHKFMFKANYILENASTSPAYNMLISEKIPLQSLKVEHANTIIYDSVFNTYFIEFKYPVLPEQRVKVSYEILYKKKKFEINNSLVKNGTYLTSSSFEPSLGYRSALNITDTFERQKRGLPKSEKKVPNDIHLNNDQTVHAKKINFETIISTESKQTAIAPGELILKWKEGNRNYYHYKSKTSIAPSIAYFSANYKIKKEEYLGISLEQYYDLDHSYNIENITNSSKLALDYCTENFGIYPFSYLRIAEIPGHWPFGGFAHPGTISMVEDKLYLVDNRVNNFDLVAKRTIHEVSHQWFGHVLTPKNIPGGSIFVEGFAKYAEAVIMEKQFGKGAVWQLSKSANQRYFSGRSFTSEKEPPLYLLDGQSYLSYGKNYTVMLAIRDLIGEKKLNNVIKKIIDKHREDIEMSINSHELLDQLYSVTPNQYHQLIDDWFKDIITYDLRIENSKVKKLDNGKFEVSIDIFSRRNRTNSNGEEYPIEIDEPIQIGAFIKHPSQIGKDDDILYLKSHQIYKEKTEIKIIVDQRPKYIAIDPFGTRLDSNVNDNLIHSFIFI